MRIFQPALVGIISIVSSSAADLHWRKVQLYHDPNEACAVADYNNDGKLDISAGRNLFLGPDFIPRPLREVPEFGVDYLENNGEHAIDVDGDGWIDVVGGSYMGKEVYWYKNPGAKGIEYGKLWQKQLLQVTAQENEITFLREMVGGQKPEFVVDSWNPKNPMTVWKFTQADGKPTFDPIVIGNVNGHGMGFGDINGDGREDITFRSGWYERPADDSGSTPWKLHEDWLYEQASCPMIITDLNGDGRNDVIWGAGHNYGVFWEEQLAPKDGKTQWKEYVIDKSWSQAHALAWEDIDNDGQPDLITGKRVRAHSGNDPGAAEPAAIYYYTWDAKTLTFTRHTIDTNDASTGLFIRVADLDGNGWKDLVMSGKTGTFIFFNEGK
ncbi:VCBS repeat-containing protein [bacterium]|nr:VCBS repeat-containing protein [bacterium]